ncbi:MULTISPECIES: TMEM43 family protein [unclassified Shinella]|uniref:TMEM43 family protein n=1 Tax=unclassified Shinella TaxID=2643062 RepID=UPI00234FB372|nr:MULTISPECIES: TMEM43 family protein [unclassified Shinella]MCO5152715.1 TMEM43 family protein [Shinella sp.]MDC7260706.1 TMEM43 family protein [Shinella sp. HY16]MDC7267601.1 TMEM43 family protein [Shinella sp. YZ44]
MSFTETTTTSWFSRLKGALIKIVVGFILLIACIWLLFWNEGRSVKTYRALVEGAGLVISVDNGSVDPANDGKLVHISGPVKPVGVPEDDVLGISADGAAGLERIVEMYQWVETSKSETRKQLGGSEETVTTYSYHKEWKRNEVSSGSFRQSGHDNPQKPIDDASFPVESATIGAFSVDGRAVARLGDERPVPLTALDVNRMGEAVALGKPVSTIAGQAVFSFNPEDPQVGDIRIRFERSDIAEASFVGAQRGSGLTPYKTTNGRDLFLSDAGLVDATTMFDAAQSENTIITWLVRVGGLVGIFIGFAFILSILGVIADVVPFVGSIVRFGTTAIALVLTLLIGPAVIAIAWIAYRPLIAIAVLAAGVALAAGILYLRRGKAAATAPALGRA